MCKTTQRILPGYCRFLDRELNRIVIAINSTDQTAYVMNYVSRDVSVIDLSGSVERVTATIKAADLPAVGSAEDKIHAGKELYNTSVGDFDAPTAGGAAIIGGCRIRVGILSSCHPFRP